MSNRVLALHSPITVSVSSVSIFLTSSCRLENLSLILSLGSVLLSSVIPTVVSLTPFSRRLSTRRLEDPFLILSLGFVSAALDFLC